MKKETAQRVMFDAGDANWQARAENAAKAEMKRIVKQELEQADKTAKKGKRR